MSKLNTELLVQSVEDLLAFSKGETIKVGGKEVEGKVRKFTETVELQVRDVWVSRLGMWCGRGRLEECCGSRVLGGPWGGSEPKDTRRSLRALI